MFISLPQAARIDRAEAAMCSGVAHLRPEGLVVPVAGGAAVFAGNGSPLNKVIGVAFEGRLDPEELDFVESAFFSRNEPVRVELCTLTEPHIAKTLNDRGYILHGFENVLGLAPAQVELPPADQGIRVASAASDADLRHWIDISVTAFTQLDGTGSVVDDALDRNLLEKVLVEMTSAPGFRRYLAWVDGTPVGAASLRIDGTLAQVCGAGTLPAARGRGVQKALLRQRLQEARQAGCDLAVVTTAPGSRSQENVMRRGFALLYARAVMIKSGK